MSHSLGSFLNFAFLRLLGQAALFLFPLVVAGFISADDFGRFSLAMMALFMFTAIGIQASQKPYIVQASREFDESGATRVAFTSRALLTAGVFVLVFVLALVFKQAFLSFSGLAAENFRWLLAAFFVFSLRFIYMAIFITTDTRILAPLLELCIGILQLGVLGLLYLFAGINLGSAIAAVFIGYGLAALLATPMLPFKALLPLRFDREANRALLNNTLWYTLGAVAVYLINWGDNLVLRLYLGFEQIGYYNFGYQVFKGMLICFSTITLFFLPNMRQFLADKALLNNFRKKTQLQLLGLGTAGLIVLGLLLAPVLQLVYGDKYDQALPVMYCLLGASFFALYYILQLTIVEGMARFKFVQAAHFMAVAVNLGLDFLLIPTMGILGAAVATTVAYASLAILLHFYVARLIRF